MSKIAGWTFLSNHGRVLMYVHYHPRSTVREMAQETGITERAVLKVLSDLASEDYLVVTKEGRNNVYKVKTNKTLRHPLEKGVTISRFVGILKA